MSRLAPSAQGWCPDRRLSASSERLLEILRAEGGRRPWRRWPDDGAAPNTVREHLNTLVRTGLAPPTREPPRAAADQRGPTRRRRLSPKRRSTRRSSVVLSRRSLAPARTREPTPRSPARTGGASSRVDVAPPPTPESARDRHGPARRPRLRAATGRRRAVDGPPHPVPAARSRRTNPQIVCNVHLGMVRGVLREYGADPTGSDLVPFAEPGACVLVVPPVDQPPVRTCAARPGAISSVFLLSRVARAGAGTQHGREPTTRTPPAPSRSDLSVTGNTTHRFRNTAMLSVSRWRRRGSSPRASSTSGSGRLPARGAAGRAPGAARRDPGAPLVARRRHLRRRRRDRRRQGDLRERRRPAAIGLMVNTSVGRRYLEPSTAVAVHDALGLPTSCQNFDVTNACLGFVNGMEIAAAMIDSGHGRLRAGRQRRGRRGHPGGDHQPAAARPTTTPRTCSPSSPR